MRPLTKIPAVMLMTVICGVPAGSVGAQTTGAPYEMYPIPEETNAQRWTREAVYGKDSSAGTGDVAILHSNSPDNSEGPRQLYQIVRPRDGSLLPGAGGVLGRCSQATSGAFEPSGRFLYTEGVCGFRIDRGTGALTPISGSPFPSAPGTNGVGAVAIDPTGRFLFQMNGDSGNVTAYRIDRSTGVLTIVAGSPFPAGAFPIAGTVDASARFLYVANNSVRNDLPSSISGYAIDPATGALSVLPGSPYPAPSNALEIATDPRGRFVYLSGAKLAAYAIDSATGALAPIGAPLEQGGRGLAVEPSGRFLYLTVFDGIAGYAIGAGGELASLGPTVNTGDHPGGIGVSSSGRYLYAANILSGTVSGYAIDWSTGALTPVPGSPFPTNASPIAVATGGFMPDVDFAGLGFPYANRVVAYGGAPPFQRTIIDGRLPPGLTLDAPTGVIHGTPTAAGTFSFTVQAADRLGQAVSKAYSIAVSPTGLMPGSGNYQGLWWNSPPGSEAGWGVNFAHQGDILFATWFTYDASGKPRWLAAVLNRSAERVYQGDLFTTTGPAFTASPWDGATVVETTVGTASVTFADDDNGSFAYAFSGVSQQKPIMRQVFAGQAAACTWGGAPDLARATNYQDLWWKFPANSEPGWGVNFTQQADLIFATWFTYGADGKPLWLIAVAQLQAGAGNVYTGPVSTVTGPAFSAVPWNPATVAETVVGSTTITFVAGDRATFTTTVNGVTQTKEITRQVFAPPGTLCR